MKLYAKTIDNNVLVELNENELQKLKTALWAAEDYARERKLYGASKMYREIWIKLDDIDYKSRKI